ncbi:indolepyruvate ferredoxin oxidoreductase [compost metagenome]
MSLAEIRLDDKYRLATGHLYLTGTQALTRLPMLQKQRDKAHGLNTACFISGYRGSPLGNLDKSLWEAKSFLKENHVHFQPGVNEELAKARAWTAAAMSSNMATRPAYRPMAASCCWPAMTTAASRRASPTRANTPSSPPPSRC